MKVFLFFVTCMVLALGQGGYCTNPSDDRESGFLGQLMGAQEKLQSLKADGGLNPKSDQDPRDNSLYLNFLFDNQDKMMNDPVNFLLALGSEKTMDADQNSMDENTIQQRLTDILMPLLTDYAALDSLNPGDLIQDIVNGFLTGQYQKSWGPFLDPTLPYHDINPFFIHFNNMLIERPVYFFLKLTSAFQGDRAQTLPAHYGSLCVDALYLTDDFIHNGDVRFYLETLFYPMAYAHWMGADDGPEKARLIAQTFATIHVYQDYVTLLTIAAQKGAEATLNDALDKMTL